MEKLTQTIETLGLPFVGYKMQSENIDQYLLNRAVAEQYGILPPFFFQSSSDGETFKERVAIEFLNVINDALKEKNVGWKISKLDVCHSGKILSAGRYIFHGTSDYGEVRKVMNSLDWDAIALSVQKEVDGDNDTYEYVELKDEVNRHPLDERWLELWENDAEFDQVFWSAYEKTDIIQWRGYAVQQGLTTDAKYPRALDFICWAMMTQDYDEFMTLIKDDKQVNAKTGIDLFDSINTTQTTKTNIITQTTMEKTKELQTENKTVALTATSAVTADEQTRFFKGALAIPQIAASEKEWSRTGGTFETLVLHAKDVDAYFTCDTKIVKTTGKPSNKKYQWIIVEGEKFSWNNIGDATLGFEALAKENYSGMAKYMTEPSAKKWTAMLNGEVEPQSVPAQTPQKEEPKAEQKPQPKAKAEIYAKDRGAAAQTATRTTVRPTFKGTSYMSACGSWFVQVVPIDSNNSRVCVIDKNLKCVTDAEYTISFIVDAKQKMSLSECTHVPMKYRAILSSLGLEEKVIVEEPKTEQKPQPKTKEEQPKVEEPKADRVTIDKRDGGLFIGGADADIEMLIRSYVDAINAMQMRKIG